MIFTAESYSLFIPVYVFCHYFGHTKPIQERRTLLQGLSFASH